MASYERHGKGWTVRFRMFENGRQKQIRLSGFRTKKEAQQAFAEYQATHIELQDGFYVSSHSASPVLFEHLVSSFYRLKQKQLKESSYLTAKGKIDAHILSAFGAETVQNIRAADILNWQNGLHEKGYSYKYIAALRTYLNAILSHGEKYHDLPNPARKVDKPRNLDAPKKIEVWTPEQFSAFLQQQKDPVYHAFFHTLYGTGCRKGEALALSPADLDRENATLCIEKSLTYKTKSGRYAVTTPKNKTSNRTLPISSQLRDELSALADTLPPNAPFLFGGSVPLAQRSIYSRYDVGTAAAGLPKITIHALRHSHASHLLSAGVPIVAVSKRLGHANVTQTLNTYAHMMPSDDDKIRTALSQLESSS